MLRSRTRKSASSWRHSISSTPSNLPGNQILQNRIAYLLARAFGLSRRKDGRTRIPTPGQNYQAKCGSNVAHVEDEKSKYYPAFDYLRIGLASVVALGHSGAHIWEHAGDFSVQVFFALSGWLIGGILLRSSPSDLPRFYFNRAARIWVPYFVAIALLMLASLLKEPFTSKWMEIFFYDATFTYNFFGPPQLAEFKNMMPLEGTGNHFWSICAEEQFYLFAPFLITILTRVGRTIWFWCLISAAALSCPYWGYFGSISLGVLASVVRVDIGDWHATRPARLFLAIVAILSFYATYKNIIPYRIGAPLSAVGIILLLAQVGQHSRVASFLGGISYPMYLNHWIGTFAVNAILTNKVSLRGTFYSAIASVAFAMLIAAILFLCIDRVVRMHRDEYFSVARGKAVALCGFTLLTTGVMCGLMLAWGAAAPRHVQTMAISGPNVTETHVVAPLTASKTNCCGHTTIKVEGFSLFRRPIPTIWERVGFDRSS